MSGSRWQVILAWAICGTIVMGAAGAMLWRAPRPPQHSAADNTVHDVRYDGCLVKHQGNIAVCDALMRMSDTDREKAEQAMKQTAALPDEIAGVQPSSRGPTPSVSNDQPVLQRVITEGKNSESRERRSKHRAVRRKRN